MVGIHINKHKHITVSNLYIPPRNAASPHNATLDTDKLHTTHQCTHYSILTGDVKAHSSISYTHDHRGTLILNTKKLLSYHLSIIVTLATTTTFKHHQHKHSYPNFKKANWIKFTEETEVAL